MGADECGHPRTTAGATGTRKHAERGQYRQSIGQNDGKGGVRGYDGGKKVKGRKRHLVVDTEGFVLKAFVSEAHYYDGSVGCWLLPALKAGFPRLSKLWADGTYAGTFVEQAQALGIDVEITTRLSDSPGFQVVPHRWVSERTFAWLGNYRRLSKDYEYWVYAADAMIYAAMIHVMVRRLARLQSPI
jgi:putative transposase